MDAESEFLIENGLEVIDLATDAAFQARRLHERDAATQLEGVRRLANVFLNEPEDLLQELVRAAVELCGADSAAISLIKDDGTEQEYYRWVASEGVYANFLDAMLPREPSACGVCLKRGRPQRIRVFPRFFEVLGVQAPPVTDGLLLPWRVDESAGTIFVMAHTRDEAFDRDDLRTMEMLADFAAMGVRQIGQRRRLMQQANAAAAAAMAHELAHEINNPLQSITNLLYLSSRDEAAEAERLLATQLSGDVARLNAVARSLLESPKMRLDALRAADVGR